MILDEAAISFCYYNNHHTDSKLISLEDLNKVINYAKEKDLVLNFIYGQKKLPAAYEKLIEVQNAIRIIPAKLAKNYADAIVVLESKSWVKDAELLTNSNERNIILRVSKDDLDSLNKMIFGLKKKCRRINVTFIDLEQYRQSEID